MAPQPDERGERCRAPQRDRRDSNPRGPGDNRVPYLWATAATRSTVLRRSKRRRELRPEKPASAGRETRRGVAPHLRGVAIRVTRWSTRSRRPGASARCTPVPTRSSRRESNPHPRSGAPRSYRWTTTANPTHEPDAKRERSSPGNTAGREGANAPHQATRQPAKAYASRPATERAAGLEPAPQGLEDPDPTFGPCSHTKHRLPAPPHPLSLRAQRAGDDRTRLSASAASRLGQRTPLSASAASGGVRHVSDVGGAVRSEAKDGATHGAAWRSVGGRRPPHQPTQSRTRESHPSLLRTREASSLRRPARRTPRARARDARVAAKGGVEPPSPRLTAERLAIGLLRNSEPDRVALRGRGEVGPRAGVHGEHVRCDDLGEAVVSRRTLCLPCPCKNPCIRVPPHRCRVVRDRCPSHASGERRRGFRELDSNQRDAGQSRVSCR